MIPKWPEKDLPPRFLMDSFSLGPADSRLNTKMDSGAVKTRVRASRAPRPFATGIIATVDQSARLDKFIRDDLARGGRPFLIRDQVMDGVPLLNEQRMPLLDPQGRVMLNTAWWLVKFGEKMPTMDEAVTDRHFRISFDLLILP